MTIAELTNPAASAPPGAEEDALFAELRRKVRACELLSASTLKLLQRVRFSGRLSLRLENGRILKCGYEEGYFRNRDGRLLE